MQSPPFFSVAHESLEDLDLNLILFKMVRRIDRLVLGHDQENVDPELLEGSGHQTVFIVVHCLILLLSIDFAPHDRLFEQFESIYPQLHLPELPGELIEPLEH